jgi:hypothetical protein
MARHEKSIHIYCTAAHCSSSTVQLYYCIPYIFLRKEEKEGKKVQTKDGMYKYVSKRRDKK